MVRAPTEPRPCQPAPERDFPAALLDRDLPRLRTVAHRILGCHDRAEDAVQEAIARLWQLRDRIDVTSVRAWLTHAVLHRSLHIRRTERRRGVHEARAADQRQIDAGLGPEQAAETLERVERVRAEIDSLPGPLREPVRLRYASEMSYREIADALELPIGTVRSRLSRARRMLAAPLRELTFDVECPICVPPPERLRSGTNPEQPPNDPRRVAVCPEQDDPPECEPTEHEARPPVAASEHDLEKAVRVFKALGDPARLRLLLVLQDGETCVSELATPEQPLSSVSTRLRLLRLEGLVRQRRHGKHVFYSLADDHVAELIRNALEHARELR